MGTFFSLPGLLCFVAYYYFGTNWLLLASGILLTLTLIPILLLGRKWFLIIYVFVAFVVAFVRATYFEHGSWYLPTVWTLVAIHALFLFFNLYFYLFVIFGLLRAAIFKRRNSVFKVKLTGGVKSFGTVDKTIKSDEKDVKAYNDAGVAKNKLGDHIGALKDFKKAVELDPKCAEAYHNRGNTNFLLRDYSNAVEDYNKTIELDPKYTRAYHYRGCANTNLKNYTLAIKDLDTAIELNPKDALAYYFRGLAKYGLRYDQGALEDFRGAESLGHPNARGMISMIQEVRNKNLKQSKDEEMSRVGKMAPEGSNKKISLPKKLIIDSWEYVIAPQFKSFNGFDSTFRDGLALVENDAGFGYINVSGDFVIKSQFVEAGPFSEGLACVRRKENEEELWGYINKRGENIINPQFKIAGTFSEGLAPVSQDFIRWGFIDVKGRLVISPKFHNAWPYSDGLAAVEVNRKCGFIDRKGNYIIEPKFDYSINLSLFLGFSEGLAAIAIKTGVMTKSGYINKKGEFVIEPKFDWSNKFSEGLAPVLVEDKYGYINKKGEMVIKPQFNCADPFSEGLAPVMINPSTQNRGSFSSGGETLFQGPDPRDGDWGFIDKAGNYIIKPQFERAKPFSEGLGAVRVKGKWGYIRID